MEFTQIQARTLVEAVCARADLAPDVRAVVDQKGIHTYRQFWQDVCTCAEVLQELGLKRGERLVMECSQDEMFLAVNYACQLTGVIFVGVERRVAPDRLQEIVRQTGAARIFAKKVPADAPEGYLGLKEFAALFEKTASEHAA